MTRKFIQKAMRPSYCPDGQPHVRRLDTPGGGLTVGSVCRRCGEKREYRAVEAELPTEFSLRSGERQLQIREMGL